MDRSLAELCMGLAERAPVPSAGGLAAFQAAAGASLASMAFRATSGEAQADVAPFMVGRADELDVLRAEALALIERDEAAFASVPAAGGEPAALRAALEQALEVPFDTLETALAALRIAAVGAPDAAAELRADCLVAGAALRSAIEGAAALVRANADALARAGAERAGADELATVLAEVEAMCAEAAGLLGELRAAAASAGVGA